MGLSTNQALLQAGTLEFPKPSLMKRQSSSSQQQQQQQQQGEQLKCPRCDSTNTKFCYYNNYNKSQPRHFCKTCKRHWTKGGTLRNVPVGGGRKNKRKPLNAASKTASRINSTTSSATTTATCSGITNTNMSLQAQQPTLSLPLQAYKGVDDKNFSGAFYQTLGRQTTYTAPEDEIAFYNKSLNESNGGIFLGSTLSLLQSDQDLKFPYSNKGSFESDPCSISSTISSIQSPNLFNYKGEANAMEDTVMNQMTKYDHQQQQQQQQQPWQMSNIMEMSSSNWGWDDFDKFVSVDADIGVPWDDIEMKP